MLLRLVAEDSVDNSNRLYLFCHAIPGFKFKQVDFRHFKKSLSKTAVIVCAHHTVYTNIQMQFFD